MRDTLSREIEDWRRKGEVEIKRGMREIRQNYLMDTMSREVPVLW